MLRIALIDVFMFALPFLLYGAYMLATRSASPAGLWQDAPVVWLLAAGATLLLITMGFGFTGYLPMPIRHGLTIGELARLFNGERKIGADLIVVPMTK